MRRVLPVTRIAVIALVATIAGIVIPCPAAVQRWSDGEKDCAETIGVNLRVAASPSDPHYERRLAWVSELIVRGTVTKIQHDIRGTYPTIVTLSIASVLKGDVSVGSTIGVNLFSGPTYSEQQGDIAPTTLIGEPTFAVGEDVLLFLTTSHPEPVEEPRKYALAPGTYLLVNKSKWLIEGTTVTHAQFTDHRHSLDWIQAEVGLTVRTQQSNCE
jgi:hypothetical protein